MKREFQNQKMMNYNNHGNHCDKEDNRFFQTCCTKMKDFKGIGRILIAPVKTLLIMQMINIPISEEHPMDKYIVYNTMIIKREE
ncbi:unnamed protein product [Caretta caretta]